MAKKQQKLSFRSWFRRMFRQPPAGFYSRPCMYWAGGILEIEHFRKIRSYDEEKLCLEFGQNVLTIYGGHLRIETLAIHRLTLKGEIRRTDFSESADRSVQQANRERNDES